MVYTPAFGGSVPIKIDGTAATVAGGVITDVRAVAAGETVAIPANGYVMVFGNDLPLPLGIVSQPWERL